MTNKDRLIELVNKAKEEYASDVTDHTETDYIVERLLNEGVIVPPCKIGNTVWWIDKKRVLDMVCVGFLKTHKKFLVSIARNTNAFTTHYYVEWNVDIFLTKEEAEAKLKE